MARLRVHTYCCPHWLPETLFLWVEKAGIWCLPLSSGFEFKNKCSCNSTPLYVFMLIPATARSKACLCCRLFMKLWVRIPLGTRKSVSCESCVLSHRGLCVGLITRSEESYWVWCVWVWSRIPERESHGPQDGPKRHRNENKMSS
jgi:hypothetical protein